MRQSPFWELLFRWMYRTNPQLRCFAACSGFHDIGPAPRNLQLILNLLAFVGAWLRRDAIASYVCLVCCNSKFLTPDSKFFFSPNNALF